MKDFMKRIVALLGASLLLAGQVQAATTVTFYHHDALGSVVASSNMSGDHQWNEEYQPYGEKIYDTIDTEGGSDDWYTGKNYDRELDLTYFGARWYDAKQGRFLSMDPAGVNLLNPHTFNRYHYASNNPYKYLDPDGEETNPVSGTSFIKDYQLRTNKSNPIVGKFGKTRNGRTKSHNGVDIYAPNGTRLLAPISGKVIAILEDHEIGGNVVFVEAQRGENLVVIGLAHLESISVEEGDRVTEGVTTIGRAGSTGNAEGTRPQEEHVHLTVRVNGILSEPVDPQEHFRNNPRKVPLEQF